MSFLIQLGIDGTYFFQMALFIIVMLFLSSQVFLHYFIAFEGREKKTTGSQEHAVELHKQTSELHQIYEVKTQEVHHHIKNIYDSYKEEANKEYYAMIAKKRMEAAQLLEQTRNKVQEDLKKSKDELTLQIPAIAKAIKDKMVSKV